MPYTSIKFSVDLKSAAFNHLNLLQLYSSVPALEREDVLQQALYRYRHFWLPLAAKHSAKKLEPPIDIAWIWHCHMLAPVAYCTDCIKLVDIVVPNKTLNRSAASDNNIMKETAKIWESMYQAQHPYQINLDEPVNPAYKDAASDFSYDIIAAALRQKQFGYQVSLPHYRDPKFLKNAKDRYKKFIYLRKTRPNMFLVPCYDIDLMWHTHQLHPVEYSNDMEKLLGKPFNHDDSVNDRSEGSKLSVSNNATREAWRIEFKENNHLFGCMWRGDNPVGKLSAMTKQDALDIAIRSATVVLERIEVRNMDKMAGKPRFKIHAAWNDIKATSVTVLKGTHCVWQDKCLSQFKFDTAHHNQLMFTFQDCTGWACLGSRTVLASEQFDMLSFLDSLPLDQQTSPLDLSITDHRSGIVFDIKGFVKSVQVGCTVLHLKQGQFESCIMPEYSESIWGPIPLPRLPPGTDNVCMVASHRLIDHRQNVTFTCRVIHSLPLMQSAVHVFHKDKMVVVAHLISADTLPCPTQVSNRKECVTLNPKAGDRAILIKNDKGDWAIVVGRWSGFRQGRAGVKGTPGKKGIPGVPGSSGSLRIKVFQIGSGKHLEMCLPYQQNTYTIKLFGMVIDLKSGVIKVDESNWQIAENLALAFSISLLHVLCQPRPKGWKPGVTTVKTTKIKGNKAVRTIPSEDMAFVMASGYLMATPSNHYMRERYGANVCCGCGGGTVDGGVEVVDMSNVDCGSLGAPADVGAEVGDAGGGDGGAGCGGCGGCGGCVAVEDAVVVVEVVAVAVVVVAASYTREVICLQKYIMFHLIILKFLMCNMCIVPCDIL